MSRTASLRRQHDSALKLVEEAQRAIARIGEQPRAEDVFPLTMILAKLTGTLRIHLVLEDRCLYPELMASRPEIADTAREFFDEMGELAPQITRYSETWLNSQAILENWRGFRRDTTMIFAALAERIERENTILYPLADALVAEGAMIGVN